MNGLKKKRGALSVEQRRYSLRILSISALSAIFVFPVSMAYGVQSHGAAEGLVSHQLGHLLFFSGMVLLLQRLRQAALTDAGWKDFEAFLWLIAAWNVLAFAGHWMREGIAKEQFIRHSNQITAFQVESLYDFIFYLTRLDHLVLVPAIFLLLSAMRKWGREQ